MVMFTSNPLFPRKRESIPFSPATARASLASNSELTANPSILGAITSSASAKEKDLTAKSSLRPARSRQTVAQSNSR